MISEKYDVVKMLLIDGKQDHGHISVTCNHFFVYSYQHHRHPKDFKTKFTNWPQTKLTECMAE